MRRKVTLRCCLIGVGVPVSIWFMINILHWNFKPSTDWFAPSPNAGRLQIRAKKLANSKHSGDQKSESDNWSLKNSQNDVHEKYDTKHDKKEEINSIETNFGNCEEVQDYVNKDVAGVYDVKVLNRQGIVLTPEDQKDQRRGCQDKKYSNISVDASIIICFYNEALSALLRNIYSVLERTPKKYLKEIIVVDDSSDIADVGCKVEKYLHKHLPNVKFLRTPERQGLIRARIYGANHASGKVVIFLDSHCEVNKEWIQPLLARISENSKVVAVPVIDIINQDTLEYQASPLVRGGFNWGLHFRWDSLPPALKLDPQLGFKPIESPTMAGGLFAMDRDYFHYLGDYDSGLEVWGGENLEISFRIWMCGGKLEIIPCSRVGHIFRKRRPYGSPKGGDSLLMNSLRVAQVWMDKYKEYFFKQRPQARDMDYGDVSDRIALRKKLQCQSFHWYLKHIYPEQPLPDSSGHMVPPPGNLLPVKKKAKVLRHGQFIHTVSQLCIQSEKDVFTKKALLTLKACESRGRPLKVQTWYETEESELILAQLLCLDAEDKWVGKSYARLMKCHGSKGSQAWTWTVQNGVSMLYNPGSGKCLATTSNDNGAYLSLEICSDNSRMGFELRRP
ncbi:hypothetical protein FSP39_003078 [Pinctada imbricata]|uniref:Polypeptide N-acetylgalactosaminyltransferase n=1 Tax=Pinctada imbricata TaxID=66713 RepID=A0AA88YA44_PINIB|nr:hypothetical protein FSP39_003078 [Pinctada imbricata]